MPYELIKKSEDVIRIKLSGKMTVRDLQELQYLARLELEQFGQFRMLIELESFQGWSKETGWDNSYFLEGIEGSICKLAIVGDEKWKDEVFMFTGKPMRQIAIEFFPKEQFDEAQSWLSE